MFPALALLMLGCDGPDSAIPDPGPTRPANLGCAAPPRPADPSSTIRLEAFGPIYNQAVGAIRYEGDWLVIEKSGLIRDGQGDTWVDLSDDVLSGGERGLLGLAIDGDTVYVSYTAGTDSELESRVERFTVGQPDDRELLFSVDQPAKNHNGGRLMLDGDGALVVAFGDGGGGGAPVHALDPADPLGNLLRITDTGVEAIAWGLRNPWGWSFDRETGDIWVADVGWLTWEEVNLVAPGANLGWPAYEGQECIKPDLCDPSMQAPLAVYDHDQGKSITGGYVSRGPDLPALYGHYLYGDFVSGRVWGLDLDPDTGAWRSRLLLESGLAISSFAEDDDGNIVLIQYGAEGRLHRILPAEEAVQDDFPYQLSQTGCLNEDGLVPYDVLVPLWSDGAEKDRWLALPDDTSLTLVEGALELPVGGVALKHFEVDGERVETRLWVRDEQGYTGYSYLWDGGDAVFSPARRQSGDHILPARGECIQCHTERAGFTLGLEPAQLSVAHTERLQAVDYLPELGAVARLDDSARAVLHANCSGCHRPDDDLDLRFEADVDWCAPPARSPQDTLRAAVLARVGTRGAGQMPPLATDAVDTTTLALLEQELPPCP